MRGIGESELLKGKRVLLTGAGGAIGGGIRRALGAHGAEVIGFDVKGGDGIRAGDASDPAAVAAAFDASKPTDAVHAAGTLIVGAMADADLDAFQHAIQANLVSAFVVAREAARRLQTGGSLTLLASQAAYRGSALWGPYSAVKAGVMRLSESLAKEIGPKGIRVNCVCPGLVASPMLEAGMVLTAEGSGLTTGDVRANYTSGIPLGRFADPDEIGAACVYLMSPLASYISGIALPVDGGEVSW
jgi:NAD(P)-dependent dehydrogenase (short-subunit alcohol dehydrogenase family)